MDSNTILRIVCAVLAIALVTVIVLRRRNKSA